jgi:tetratricopeptide (TPR) repeat protein
MKLVPNKIQEEQMKRILFPLALSLLVMLSAFTCFGETGMETAEALFQEGKFQGAMALYENILKQDPNSALVFRRIANCLEQSEKYDDALKNYDRAIKLDPYFYDAYYEKALLLYNTLRKADQAFQALSVAVDNSRKSKDDKEGLARVYIMRSIIFRARKDYDSAGKDITSAIHLISDPAYFFMRGELKMEIKDFAGAKRDFKKALDLTQGDDEDTREMKESIQDDIAQCDEAAGEKKE